MTVTELLDCVGIVIVISVTTPLFLLVLVPVIIVFYFSGTYYRHSSREFARILSKRKSPLFSKFSATLTGVSTIRAYNYQDLFITRFSKALDNVSKSIKTLYEMFA